MPSNWLYIDTNFPTFTGEENTEEKISTIQNYLFMLVEQLRYSLHNLDSGNMNQTALSRFEKNLTEPLYGRIEDAEGNLTELAITAKGIATRVSDAEGNISVLQQTATSLSSQISDANGNISVLQQTATKLSSQISDANGNISVLQQTATRLSSQISDANGNISVLQQTATSLSSTVADQNGKISAVVQTVNGLTIKTENGTTMIDGGNVYTDTMRLSSLYGNIIYLRDNYGNIGAQFNIGEASSAADRCEMWARAIQIASYPGDIYLDASTAALQVGSYRVQVTGDLIPNSANRYMCGSSQFPWMDVYAQNGSISSSDRAGKKEIDYSMERYRGLFDRLRPCTFLRTEGTSGRRHHGFVAQDVAEAVADAGLTAKDFAGYVEWEGGCGLRYEELLAMIVYEVQEVKEITFEICKRFKI